MLSMEKLKSLLPYIVHNHHLATTEWASRHLPVSIM
jgi:hypothetical protein